MKKLLGILILVCAVTLPLLNFLQSAHAQDLPEKDNERELFDEGEGVMDDSYLDEELVDQTSGDSSSKAQVQGMFEISAEIGTQSVLNNEIPLTLTIRPKIDSKKAEVKWDLPRGLTARSETNRWFTMEKDVPRTFTLEVEPEASGRYVIVADVTAWRYDTNYVASAEIELQIDENLHVYPMQEEYKNNRTIMIVLTVVGVIIAGNLVFFGAKLALNKYRQWMAKD